LKSASPMLNRNSKLRDTKGVQMGRLTKLIRERRGRQENPDRTEAIYRIFIDPVTKQESTVDRRLASVIGGPRLQQEPEESNDAFETRVRAVADELRMSK
jgi:hypothetical protein